MRSYFAFLIFSAVALAVFNIYGMEADLSVDRKDVSAGDEINLKVSVTGEGELIPYSFEQPDFYRIENAAVLSVSQGNQTYARGGGTGFRVAFFCRLRAKGPGPIVIPDLSIPYKKEGDEEALHLNVKGAEITVRESALPGSRSIVLAILVIGIIIVVVILIRRRGAALVKEEVEPERYEGIKTPDAALKALAGIEDAAGLRIRGDHGACCAALLAALDGYLKTEQSDEIEGILNRLRDVCERVKYASDERAESEIADLARKAELYFKKRIREEIDYSR